MAETCVRGSPEDRTACASLCEPTAYVPVSFLMVGWIRVAATP